MISNFQSYVIVNDLGWGDRILANFALFRISTRKKRRGRLLCLGSTLGFRKCKVFRRVTEEGYNNHLLINREISSRISSYIREIAV
jgi:hypothetical protein